MFSEDQRFWILAHVFRGPRVFWALAHVFKGPKVLDPGSCCQRPRIFGLWLMFSETKGSRSWLMFSEDQGFLEGIIHVDVRGPFTPVLAK